MFCAISGQVPDIPVVAVKTGFLYEKRLIEKALETTGKCPVSQIELSKDDLCEVKSTSIPAPRPVEATSIAGMLSKFQSEWDSLMLETFQLRQNLQNTKKELAQALYQHDAACRVIARVTAERDEARRLLGSSPGVTGKRNAAMMDVEEEASRSSAKKSATSQGLSAELKSKILSTSQKLMATRKKWKKNTPEGLVTVEEIGAFKQTSTHTVHKTTAPGVSCLDIHPTISDLVATGGVDGDIKLFDHKISKQRSTLSGHKKSISQVCFHDSDPMIVSASADHSARVWVANGSLEDSDVSFESAQVFEFHSAAVSGCCIQPTGDMVATVSNDKSWALADIRAGTALLKESSPSPVTYTCAGFHPDGALLATGATERVVQIWDITESNLAFSLEMPGQVTSVSFSESGYHFAAGDSTGIVNVWDLRKLQKSASPLKSVTRKDRIGALSFDATGNFLGYAHGRSYEVLHAKSGFESVLSIENAHKKAINGLKFGTLGSFIATGGSDRCLKFFGTK